MEDRIQKSNFTTLEVKDGTSGEEICDMVFKALEDVGVDKKLLMSDQTDGCPAMLGKFTGCHTLAKEQVTHLPDLGGCVAHDACNIIKHGVKKMNSDLTTLYKCVHANLEKHSMKKNRHFQEVFDDVGAVFKHVPKFLDVRFRYVLKLADYMDVNDRPLYLYYTELVNKFKGKEKQLSQTETMIIDLYLGNYINIRLTNKFLISVCKPFIQFIDYFESREVLINYRWEKMMLLLNDHLALFLKNGGVGGDMVTVDKLLEVKPTESDLLPKEEVFVGAKVKQFLKEIDMNPNSPELKDFFKGVFDFYKGSREVMQKYFKTGLESKTLKLLTVLTPNSRKLPLDESKRKWRYLAKKFPNVVDEGEVDELMRELSSYRQLEDPEDEEVDEWWAKVSKVEIGNEKSFCTLSKLALALCTMYNSSSEAERDFAKQNDIFASSKKSSMGQRKLQSRLQVMSATSEIAKSCKRCIENQNKRKKDLSEGKTVGRWKVNHCHCTFMVPNKELMAKLRNCDPAKKYHEELGQIERDENEIALKQDLDKQAALRDLKKEVRQMKNKFYKRDVPSLFQKRKGQSGTENHNNKKRKASVEQLTTEEKKKKETPLQSPVHLVACASLYYIFRFCPACQIHFTCSCVIFCQTFTSIVASTVSRKIRIIHALFRVFFCNLSTLVARIQLIELAIVTSIK